jgi:hypothetical protein
MKLKPLKSLALCSLITAASFSSSVNATEIVVTYQGQEYVCSVNGLGDVTHCRSARRGLIEEAVPDHVPTKGNCQTRPEKCD